MNLDSIRSYCLSFPHATEDIKWGNDLMFSIGGKIFAGVSLEPPHNLAFKCTPEKFDELIEIDGIIPAPYMARNKWVSLLKFDALSDSETKALLRKSYELVLTKLPKKVQSQLSGPPQVKARKQSGSRR